MKSRMIVCSPALLLAALVAVCRAQEPIRIPSSGGEVVIATKAEKDTAYDQYHYATSRRLNDTLYISGVVAGRRDGEGRDATAFKAEVRRAFERLKATLAASGAGFNDIVMLNTFHVWDSPEFEGGRAEQFRVFSEVKDEFMRPPYPAWTAVGTTHLIPDNGIVEIQAIAHVEP